MHGRAIQGCLFLLLGACGDPGGDACEDYAGLATPEEIASTPRPDPEMEMLALALTGGLAAREADYERVSADVTAIREMDPRVADIHVFPGSPMKRLWIIADDATLEAVAEGTYHAWDCANALYGASLFFAGPPILLDFQGVLDMDLLAGEYEELPGISDAGPDVATGDGPTVCVTAEGEIFHYVFDDASGDCPAGCSVHGYFHYTSLPGVPPVAAGEWSTESAEVQPAWVSLYECPFGASYR